MEMSSTTKVPTASALVNICKSVWLFRLDWLVIWAPKLYLNRMIQTEFTQESHSSKTTFSYKRSQSGSRYLLTRAVALTASWCETAAAGSLKLDRSAATDPIHSACLPPRLMAPLPASLLGSVYNIKARRAQTGGHAKAHPSSLPLLSALRDGLCARATSKTPAETPRLRANPTAAQSLRADNRRDRTKDSTSRTRRCRLAWVSLTMATARRRQGWMLKLALCLSVVEQFKDTDSPHWRALWGGWRVTHSACTMGQWGHCMFTQCPSPQSKGVTIKAAYSAGAASLSD